MDKPLSIAIEEIKQSLVTTINESGLHPYILDSIVGNIYNEVHMVYLKQIEHEKQEYNKEPADNK